MLRGAGSWHCVGGAVAPIFSFPATTTPAAATGLAPVLQAAGAAAAGGSVRRMTTMRQLLRGARKGPAKRRESTPALKGAF